MLFLVIFVLTGKCFYINCAFLLFCGKALVIFVRVIFFIFQVALCSGVILCLASYLLSSIADSVFLPIAIIACVILLAVWLFLTTILCFF